MAAVKDFIINAIEKCIDRVNTDGMSHEQKWELFDRVYSFVMDSGNDYESLDADVMKFLYDSGFVQKEVKA